MLSVNLHVPLDLSDQMYVVNKQHAKEILTDVSPVGKEFSKEFLRELAAQPFIVLCMCIRLMWHDTSGRLFLVNLPTNNIIPSWQS